MAQHIHILGICGTFMGGVAQLARAKGFRVTGQDANVYPPMSTQLEQAGIELIEGYESQAIATLKPDCVVVGNAIKRGMPAMEYVLDKRVPYISGPQWLRENILNDKWVVGVAGTHGKTTTSSMVAWIAEYAGQNPGFLIGGVPGNFNQSARLTDSEYFVVEADEYDTAFFDKRSKFIHYAPKTCVINNVEFDHADIFDSIEDIYKQFHHLVRTLPSNGLIVRPESDAHIDRILQMGHWTPVETLGDKGQWQAVNISPSGDSFEVHFKEQPQGTLKWNLIGQHNVMNALAAIAAAQHMGIAPQKAMAALAEFQSVKRRMEIKGIVGGVTVYDDFAHHPTAIKLSLEGLRAKVGDKKIIALLDIRSNTMKQGVHRDTLAEALQCADKVMVYRTDDINWNVEQDLIAKMGGKTQAFKEVSHIVNSVKDSAHDSDSVLVMSNGGFGGIHEKLLEALKG